MYFRLLSSESEDRRRKAGVILKKMEEYFIDEFGVHFSKDRQTLIWCPSDFKGEYRIPSGVLSIENGAFTRCEGLLSLKRL